MELNKTHRISKEKIVIVLGTLIKSQEFKILTVKEEKYVIMEMLL